MAVVTKIEPLDDWIELVVDQNLSPAARSEAVATFAAARLKEAQEKNRLILGRVPPHDTFVDGRKGAPLAGVNPDHGAIIFEFELVSDVLQWIATTLRERSPVASGKYRDAHTLFADGTEVPVGSVIPPAAEYSFLNPLPSSRRIEMGKTKDGRAFVVSVPNHIYERTATDARRRFGNIAKVMFSYRAAMGRSSVFTISRVGPLQVKRNAKGQFVKGSHVRAGSQREGALRVPAIIVFPN